jgi:hypothetical protein
MKNIKIYIEEGAENMTKDFVSLLKKFIPFVVKFIKIKTPFTLYLVHSDIPQIRTTAVYVNSDNEIWIRVKNRNMMADVFRSICHEMVHHKQNEMGILDQYSGEDTSSEEGQANRIAGIVIRKFGRKYPQIYK